MEDEEEAAAKIQELGVLSLQSPSAHAMQLQLSRLAGLLFSCCILLLGVSASTTTATNNWAVLVCSVRPCPELPSPPANAAQSRFWFNYRVRTLALSSERLLTPVAAHGQYPRHVHSSLSLTLPPLNPRETGTEPSSASASPTHRSSSCSPTT